MLVLQSLYNLSGEQVEYQVRDRLSFTRFLGLGMEDGIPDGTTLWLFRETLAKAGLVEKLFERFGPTFGCQGLHCAWRPDGALLLGEEPIERVVEFLLVDLWRLLIRLPF